MVAGPRNQNSQKAKSVRHCEPYCAAPCHSSQRAQKGIWSSLFPIQQQFDRFYEIDIQASGLDHAFIAQTIQDCKGTVASYLELLKPPVSPEVLGQVSPAHFVEGLLPIEQAVICPLRITAQPPKLAAKAWARTRRNYSFWWKLILYLISNNICIIVR